MIQYIKVVALSLTVAITTVSAQNKKITNENIWSQGTFGAANVYGLESMKDGKHYTTLSFDRKLNQTVITKFAYETNEKVAVILSTADFKYNGNKLPIDEYTFNADESKILIATEQESIYRHSSKSFYYIYDVKSKKVTPLSEPKLGKQRLAEFSPNGKMIAFVRNNDLFISYLDNKIERPVTQDGEMNSIINGATDWVYEEEFSFHKGFEWSPNGSRIAFYKFNESEVKEFSMPMYGYLYPEHYKFKYPKAGEKNSEISMLVYNTMDNTTSNFDLGAELDIYVPRITWANDGYTLLVQRLNRLQNKLELLSGTFKPGLKPMIPVQIKTIFSEESKTYIDVHDHTSFSKNDDKILWTSEQDGFNHIYFINPINGALTQVTKGNWEVTDVYGYDEDNAVIYFQAAKESPTQREVYKINADGTNLVKLSNKPGTTRAEFSDNYMYYLLFHSDANTPFEVSIRGNGKKSQLAAPLVIEDNAELVKRMSEYDLSKQIFLKIKNEEGTDLNAWMIKPTNFVKGKKYPVLMFVYGGPGINTVKDSWGYGNYFWFQSLAQQGYIVVSVDARGTGYRGRDFKHSTYLQLGKYETEDQIAAAKKLGQMPFIDADRIGIFGWSYGGYMSSLCISKGADTFKAAIAVAPVTNWRYYDNIYTERFMRTPQENGTNYDVNSPINHVDKIKGSYLLVHGSADDNVHFQNAMEMNMELVNKNIPFDFMAYPNKNHGIYGGNTRLHLYNKMTQFLIKNL
ncbi:MAG: dipeptidyl-peptidase-4 [Flavobacteriales bacterium]|jgi:dipeptidyl-peptidase-4